MSISITNASYQGALSLLSQSPEANASTASTSGTEGFVSAVAGPGTDTISLSDAAKSYIAGTNPDITTADGKVTRAKGFNIGANAPSVDDWNSASFQSSIDGSGVDTAVQALEQKAAAQGQTATVQNASDVAGLDFQQSTTVSAGPQGGIGESVSLSFNSAALQSNPNNVIVFDSNPADAKLVTL
ncbi:MAG TPA: hypothetical protein VL574_07760 [Stellaceae bacterium]|nr:hypothetical protein [Stellaceae bacterium]